MLKQISDKDIYKKVFNKNFRSSVVFPIYVKKETKNKIIFLNYWSLKKKLEDGWYFSNKNNLLGGDHAF